MGVWTIKFFQASPRGKKNYTSIPIWSISLFHGVKLIRNHEGSFTTSAKFRLESLAAVTNNQGSHFSHFPLNLNVKLVGEEEQYRTVAAVVFYLFIFHKTYVRFVSSREV